MSDMFGVAATAAVALTAATARTVVQVAVPANKRMKCLGWAVYFDGTSSVNVPVRVRLLRQSSAGTMSALTITKATPRAESFLCTASHSATAEPSLSEIIDVALVHPQQGYEVKFTPGQELVVGGGERLGIECTAPQAVNATAKLLFEE